MPLYEYKCHSCGKTFEALQKFSDQPLTIHTECGGQVERLLSAPAFHLKGTGWYATDYGKGGVVPKAPESKSGEAKTDSGGESKGAEAKSGDGNSSESKSTETKSSETKTESKSTESKPATVPSSDSR